MSQICSPSEHSHFPVSCSCFLCQPAAPAKQNLSHGLAPARTGRTYAAEPNPDKKVSRPSSTLGILETFIWCTLYPSLYLENRKVCKSCNEFFRFWDHHEGQMKITRCFCLVHTQHLTRTNTDAFQKLWAHFKYTFGVEQADRSLMNCSFNLNYFQYFFWQCSCIYWKILCSYTVAK